MASKIINDAGKSDSIDMCTAMIQVEHHRMKGMDRFFCTQGGLAIISLTRHTSQLWNVARTSSSVPRPKHVLP